MGADHRAIYKYIERIGRSGLDIEDKVDIKDYFGVNIEEQDDIKIISTHLQIIDSIINNVHLPNKTASQKTPDFSAKILWHDAAAPLYDERLNYRKVLVKINLLEKSTSSDIAYTMNQWAYLYQDPGASHGDVIINLVKYLKATRIQEIKLDPDGYKSFEVYADANFCGNRNQPTTGKNPSTAKSFTVY